MTFFPKVEHPCLLALCPHRSSYRLRWTVAFVRVSFVYRRYWHLFALIRVWTISNATKFDFVFTLVLKQKLFTDGHEMLIFPLKNQSLWLQHVLPFTGHRLSSEKWPVFTQQQQQSWICLEYATTDGFAG